MRTAAVILAAGFSTRMGEPNKLLLEVGGHPILRRITCAVLGVTDTQPVVVLGHQAADVEKAIADLPVTCITNPDPSRGQSSSVRLGLENAGNADRTLVVLGDQPFLSAAALRSLLDAHDAQGGDLITVPMRNGDRGNPIVLPAALKSDILTSGTGIGCGSFTRKNPHLTNGFETTEPSYFLDVDTPEDLARARELAKQALKAEPIRQSKA